MCKYMLKLYVAGSTPRAERAIKNLKNICEKEFKGQYDIEVIDVLQSPQKAEDDNILATPALIKNLPPPIRRIVGDLSDTDSVLSGLDLLPKNSLSAKSG